MSSLSERSWGLGGGALYFLLLPSGTNKRPTFRGPGPSSSAHKELGGYPSDGNQGGSSGDSWFFGAPGGLGHSLGRRDVYAPQGLSLS